MFGYLSRFFASDLPKKLTIDEIKKLGYSGDHYSGDEYMKQLLFQLDEDRVMELYARELTNNRFTDRYLSIRLYNFLIKYQNTNSYILDFIGCIHQFDMCDKVRNFEKAEGYYLKAISLNNPYAYYHLGMFYKHIAKLLADINIQIGEIDSLDQLPESYIKNRNPTIEYLLYATKNRKHILYKHSNNDISLKCLVRILRYESWAYINKAIELGNRDAIYEYIIVCNNMDTTDYLLLAAEKKHPNALYQLAIDYSYGFWDGSKKIISNDLSFEYLLKAINQNSWYAHDLYQYEEYVKRLPRYHKAHILIAKNHILNGSFSVGIIPFKIYYYKHYTHWRTMKNYRYIIPSVITILLFLKN